MAYTPETVEPIITAPQWGSNDWIRVQVSGEEYEMCSSPMWASEKTGNYGKGLANTSKDPMRVERTGRLGEMALAKITGLGVDLAYRVRGDKCDFRVGRVKIDVKTSTRCTGYGLIYAQSYWSKRELKLSDRYVFAYIEDDDPDNLSATVILAGYIKSSTLKDRPTVPGFKGGGHQNYLVYYHECLPISQLLEGVKIFRKECV